MGRTRRKGRAGIWVKPVIAGYKMVQPGTTRYNWVQPDTTDKTKLNLVKPDTTGQKN